MKATEGPGGESDDQAHLSSSSRSSRLQQLLADSGNLTGSEARVMVALMGLRTATIKQLSESTDITRSNLYPVLDSLAAKGVCQRQPGKYALWACPEATEVLARLHRAEEARLSEALAAASRGLEEAGTILADLTSGVDDPPFALVDGARLAAIYVEAMEASVDEEVLVLNRGPYPGDLEPDPVILAALARGVKARALYVAAELDSPDGGIRRCADAYADAGVDARVVDSLPASMALIGDETVLLSLPTEDETSPVASHDAVIRHQGMVELLSAAFDHLWDRARPYDRSWPSNPDPAGGTPPAAEADADG